MNCHVRDLQPNVQILQTFMKCKNNSTSTNPLEYFKGNDFTCIKPKWQILILSAITASVSGNNYLLYFIKDN